MADLSTNTAEQLTAPAEQSIAEQKSERDVDAKLRAAAERSRLLREARGRAQPESLSERLMERFGIAAAPAETGERILRITPDEGDPLPVSDVFRHGMVPARFSTITFDSYLPRTRSQEAALAASKFWLGRALAGEGCMLALIGPQGTGKSHLLYAAANALLDAGQKPYARPWYRLADELRYGGEHPVTHRELDASDVRRSLWSQRVVMLDEVRATAATGFDDMELTKFSCHAYDSRYPMFVTSNVNPLADVMGGPAASRFTQVAIDGPDWRQP